jgi:septal ring factor EnvC (AmiA/AmiB activator)
VTVRVALLWSGVAFVACGSAQAAGSRQAELDELRRTIQESRERVAVYEREQRGLLETLEGLDRNVAALRAEIAIASAAANDAQAELTRAEVDSAAVAKRKAATERAMSKRIVALYKAGELGPVRMLFAADGFREMLSRVHTLQYLLVHDAELLARHRSESSALEKAQARAKRAFDEHDVALRGLREREGELAGERAAKTRVVASLGRDRTAARAALVELEKAARALEATLAALDAGPISPGMGASSFGALRRRLRSPVEAPIVKSFGRVVDAEFHTETFRKGVEFDAPLGTPVQAVADGQVRFAGWFRGYGKLVILDHGEQYFTVSGHLAELGVEVGSEVEAGDVIGTVGDTGSLSGPRLYFEIRHAGKPQDPLGWLGSREKG